MLCPKLTTQGQFIDKSKQGRAFAFRDSGGESENIYANALPLLTNLFSSDVYATSTRHPIAPRHLSAQTQKAQHGSGIDRELSE